MFSTHIRVRVSQVIAINVVLWLTLLALPVYASNMGGGLDGITAKIDEINTWLIGLGSVFAVTGFIWAILAFMGRLGGFSSAVTTLFAFFCP